MNPGTVIDVSILVSVSSLLVAAATFLRTGKRYPAGQPGRAESQHEA